MEEKALNSESVKRLTHQELMKQLAQLWIKNSQQGRLDSTQQGMLDVLTKEKDNRLEGLKRELLSTVSSQITATGVGNVLVDYIDQKRAEKILGDMLLFGYEPWEQSATIMIEKALTDKVVINWWKNLVKEAEEIDWLKDLAEKAGSSNDLEVGYIPSLEDLYDVFDASIEELRDRSSDELTLFDKKIILGILTESLTKIADGLHSGVNN
ncbi:MAG: hypothetical protein AB1630_08700 [bacterium]